MGALIRNLGHDLRNKLGVMKNSVYYLGMRVGNGDPKVQKHLRLLAREVDQANNMLMDLMDYAWPKNPARRDLHLNHVLERVLSRVHFPDGVSPHTEFSPELPIVQGDHVQLQHALMNIIVLAVRDLPPGGSLVVSTRVQNVHVEVCIASEGPKWGFEPPDGLSDSLVSPSDRGAALPLAVSRRLIERHGGTLDISQRGDGPTIALVRIPC